MSEHFEIPQTLYAESDGLGIAYQVFGSGTQDLVVIPGIVASIAWIWDDPAMRGMFGDLAKTFRVIVFDKRGQGLSDSFEGVPTLEERMDDVRVVMQAAGSKSAVLFAQSEGGAMAALFAATYPAAVSRLVLWGTMAKFVGSDDYPHRRTLEQMLASMRQSWGKAVFVQNMVPSRADDADYCERTARLGLQIMSPSAIRKAVIVNGEIDVRAILPQIRRPCLVLHRRGDRLVWVANGRFLADHIPEATYLELPGGDHLPWEGDAAPIVDAIRHFARADPVHGSDRAIDRFLATVLFTDIVGSTELVVKLGDAKWRDLQQRFHAIGRSQLEAQRGREIDTAGDGLFAIFDGPARAIRCAHAMAKESRAIGIEVRAGLHTGEVEASGAKVSGLTVHIGARVMALAGAGEVLVSSTVKDLVPGSGIGFEDRGTHALKGVPGDWRLSRALAG